ncbi:MAG: LLM class F420-dependent oxidoreductase [Gammaproteobacteria bacterium]|nr:LLM class F420-dependent oxidoreductase [Gammaproteobacteria bacterium]
MQYGFHMSTRGATAQPSAIASVASACDRLGYRYFGVNDHVIVATDIDSEYPYSADGSWSGASEGTCLETLTCLGFIAAHTSSIRLLTSVMVVPHRPAVLTAKMLATLDVLSQGRLTVGAGVGWMREELQALGAPQFERRGRASREYIEAMRTLWRDDIAAYEGEFVNFAGVVFEPKPVQRPGPPIWFGGEGPAARRRVARYGDGWYPVGRNPKFPLDTVELFKAGMDDVARMTEEAGRDPSAIDVAMYAPWCRLGEPIMDGGRRLPFTGSAQAIADDVGAFEAAGLGTLLLNLEAPEAEATIGQCEAFAEALKIN